MDSKIIKAWESPVNGATNIYRVGQAPFKHTYLSASKWTVGRISEDGHADGRICIYDTDGNRRVSLPVSACAVEWS